MKKNIPFFRLVALTLLVGIITSQEPSPPLCQPMATRFPFLTPIGWVPITYPPLFFLLPYFTNPPLEANRILYQKVGRTEKTEMLLTDSETKDKPTKHGN